MKSLPAILVSTWTGSRFPRLWVGNLAGVQQLSMPESKHSDCVVCDPRKIEASPFDSQQTADCKRFLIFHAIKSGISSQTPHATSWHRTSHRCSFCSGSRSISRSSFLFLSWPRVRRVTKTNVRQRKLCATCLFSISAWQCKVIEIK